MLAPSKTVIPALPIGCSLSFPTSDYVYVAPTGTPNGTRIYVFPGLGNTNSQWGTAPFSDFITEAAAAGYSVVEVDVPTNPTSCYWTNGGWQYRAGWPAALNSIRAAIDAAHGTASKNIAGGFSYGGLHAMMAAVSVGWFDGWWAHEPVTRLDQLTEFAGVGEVPRFNPFDNVGTLAPSKGWISWGTNDTRTNWTLTQQLAGKMGASVSKIQYTGQDHSTNAQNIADVLSWMATL